MTAGPTMSMTDANKPTSMPSSPGQAEGVGPPEDQHETGESTTAITNREGIVAAREGTATLREESAGVREGTAAVREETSTLRE